ncbi:nuclear transport factor 2 family protein [Seonamhaeicola sp.]|uniref:nuclear transport factor 2 family protein n=1 Tax=Seonamhaeicola sp. TaxID=1912245 RepID=UPI00260C5B2B|nr:nuclear transport factor 2 family protein [Seonamhaeicola sp.]
MSTKPNVPVLILTGLLVLVFQGPSYSQNLSDTTIKSIKTEIYKTFNKSIEAGETLDVDGIESNIDDSLKSGFIDNGQYFETFDELMVGFKQGIQGLESQDMTVTNKKITVLSESKVLLTTSGTYAAKVVDGRVLKGKFAWSFVYSKINGKWKVIHSHMSNP